MQQCCPSTDRGHHTRTVIKKDSLHLLLTSLLYASRAEKLPPEVVDRWVRNVRLKQKVTTVGRETMMVAAVSGAYFGIESICKQVRGVEEPSNTGLAGLVAGGMLGALLPGPVQARTVVLVGLMGGVLGYTTAWLSGLVPPPPPPPSSSSTGASS